MAPTVFIWFRSMPRKMSRPKVPTYRASTAMFHMISREMPALTWWTCGCWMLSSTPRIVPVALRAS